MGLRILHSADWHLDSPFAAFREEQRTYLKQAQRQIPRKIAMACRQQNCDLVLLAGDLFDGAWSRTTLEEVKSALKECNVPVMISPGNHDPWGAGSPWLESWPENVHIFSEKLESIVLTDLDCRVYGAGFHQMDSESLLEGFHAEGEELWQIGLFHGDPTNVHSNYNPVTTAQIRKSGLAYLALGHVHTAGGLEVEKTVCGWPGCPRGRGWDETGEKGCLIVDLEKTAAVQPYLLDLPGFYQKTVDCSDENALGEILPAGGNRNFYRITLEGFGKPDLRALTEQYQRFPNLQFIDHTVDPDSLWAQAGEDSLRGAYFARLKEMADRGDPELQKKILLAAEISRKLLEGREVELP